MTGADTPSPADLQRRRDEASGEHLKASARADSTLSTYKRARAHYNKWCETSGRTGYPATEATIIEYLGALHADGQNLAVSTVRVRLAAIRREHVERGLEPPDTKAIDDTVKGYIREHGKAVRRQARPLHVTDLPRILERMDLATLRGVRDRAIILVGFAGGFRRGELAAVTVGDVEWDDRGVRIVIPRSKSDQEGEGYRKTIPFGDRRETCPVSALRAWLDRSGIRQGRVFRPIRKNDKVWGERVQPAVIAKVVSDRAEAAGLFVDPEGRQTWSGHSLRRGFATDAVEAGAPAHKIRAQGGWRGAVPVQYFDAGEAWDDPAAGRLGL